MTTFLPYGRQDITDADLEAVTAVLTSDWLTQGPAVPAFEAAVAGSVGACHAVAVNSATSALHVACLALGIGPGDWVWTTPITFVASANCARYCGAEVDFVDIDPVSYNLSSKALAAKLARARSGHQPLPKAVVVVHFAGEPCDMPALGALAREYGFRIIEDASHAIGAWRGEERVGECRHSDVTVFSFHPVKIVTAAEGGVAVTESAALARGMRRARCHGIVRAGETDDGDRTGADDTGTDDTGTGADEPWRYAQHTLGYNYRMSDLHAALGLSQLARLERYIEHRHVLAARYDERLATFDLTRPARASGNRSSLHLYPILVNREPRDGGGRRAVYHALQAAGIGVNVHYIPVHTQPYYRDRGHARDPLPEAMRYYARALTLPLFGVMTFEQQDRVIEVLGKALRGASGATARRAA